VRKRKVNAFKRGEDDEEAERERESEEGSRATYGKTTKLVGKERRERK
jgi:hypothetical protein